MFLIDEIAEQRIREAIERGEFDNLPGKGEPVVLDDDTLVPDTLRVAYRILKNAGFVPPEVELRREIDDVEQLLAGAIGPEQRDAAERRLRYLLTRLDLARGGGGSLLMESRYHGRLSARLGRRPR
ncbi:MAG: DUF1992 domain-containing protein [Proteobacteria bacterium]|nr:MAG: DUF1992 domain-containing protein [Pseudomonadota bacterium]